MFDGIGWRDFRRKMEAEIDLFEFTSKKKVRWLVARLTAKVKKSGLKSPEMKKAKFFT